MDPVLMMNSDCDDNNVPPSLSILIRSIRQLESGSDVRGQFVDHPRVGSISTVAHVIASRATTQKYAPLTPFAAHCLGFAFAKYILEQQQQQSPPPPPPQPSMGQVVINGVVYQPISQPQPPIAITQQPPMMPDYPRRGGAVYRFDEDREERRLQRTPYYRSSDRRDRSPADRR